MASKNALSAFLAQGRKDVDNFVPEVGDEVYGTVVARGEGKFVVDGSELTAVFTELDCGEPTNKRLGWFGTVLKRHAEFYDPQNGDMIYVRRLADVERKDPKPGEDKTYANFRVMVQKQNLEG